jgi:hypothetical protein
VSSAVKKHLNLPKDFPASFIFSDCAFSAEDMESVFLAKSLGDFYVALQKGPRNNKIANAFLAQLNAQMCDQNNALDNPIQPNGYGFHHPLSQTSNLMAQYGLSLCDDNKPMKNRITSTLVAPIKNNELQALSQSLLCDSNPIVGAQTTAADYALSTRFSSRRLPKDLLQILHRNNQAIPNSLEPANFSMRLYMWKKPPFHCPSIHQIRRLQKNFASLPSRTFGRQSSQSLHRQEMHFQNSYATLTILLHQDQLCRS